MNLSDPLLIDVAIIKMTRSRFDTLSLKKNNVTAQRGSVLTLTAVSLLVLMGFMGLALDVGYVYMVRNELQDAADAAALAGAGQLFSSSPPSPNFAFASTKANSAILNLNNKAANADLVSGTITTGYWDLTGTITGVHATPTPPNDFPAVQVKITKSGANGAVNSFFSRVLGISTFNPTATAVAVVTGSGTANLYPMAVSDCLFSSTYWNATTNSPVLATTTSAIPGQGLAQTVGLPYVFELNSTTHNLFGSPATCNSGIWSSMNISPPSTSTIDAFISSPTQGNINEVISLYTATGNKTILYQDTPSDIYVMVPIVSNANILNTTANVTAFACIHILNAVSNGGNKYVAVQLVAVGDPHCKTPNSSGVGQINYGPLQPPRLVNYWGNTY